MSPLASQPITILVCALGGEGGGVLAEWLYAAAVRAGHRAQTTSIPGVAQRTGATTYYVEIDPRRGRAPGEPGPLFGLSAVPGEIDLLVSSELLETARQVGNGASSAARTRLVSGSARVLTTSEKMVPGDGRVDDEVLVAAVLPHVRDACFVDLSALARDSGAALSAVLYGAVAASGVLPWPRSVDEFTVRASGKGGEASLRGFAAGARAVERSLPPGAPARESVATSDEPPDLRRLGRERLIDYQDEAYARLYDERLARGAAVEAEGRDDVQRETARWLALWMAFDDIVRVARLKLAASRIERVRREVGAGSGEVVHIVDHFKPGVDEIAGLLPQPIAGRLRAWDLRRIEQGKTPWSRSIELRSQSLLGAISLRLLGALKRFRRCGARYAQEQAAIDHWLDAVVRGLSEDALLGRRIAACGRLVKGYGSTNARGKDRLVHILDHVAFGPGAPGPRAEAVRAALEAALADDAGRAFDQVLRSVGAPPRPLREKPVRWVGRRPRAPS